MAQTDGPSWESVISPPSACSHCDNQIRARHHVPVLGWLVLCGRCFDCGAGISARSPLVEANAIVLPTYPVLAMLLAPDAVGTDSLRADVGAALLFGFFFRWRGCS